MTEESKPSFFTNFASNVATLLGKPYIFVVAAALLVLWALSGPFLGFSDTWQLIVNTSTTIITFLMVFIIQNTQNRDSAALHLKLDVLLEKLKVHDPKIFEAEDEDEKIVDAKKMENCP